MVDVSTWSETPASNTTVDGVSIAEACPPGNMNNMGRAIMAGVKTFYVFVMAFIATAVTRTGIETLTNKTLTSPVINTPAVTTPTFTGTPIEDDHTITDGAAFEIDPANGSMQAITLGANRTPKATNFQNKQAVMLEVVGTAFTLTWTDTTFGAGGVIWIGSAPVLAASGRTWLTLWKLRGQVFGSTLGSSA